MGQHGPPHRARQGRTDRTADRPVDEHTLFNGWSTGKGLAATVVPAEHGRLGYDVPVAEYWPEFGAHGKSGITLAHVLTHTAGVPLAPPGLTLGDLRDWDAACAGVADLRPLWAPGAVTAYHALAFGHIVGETVRRATGRTIAQVLREEVAAPLGVDGELFFGVPEEHLPRVARLEDGGWAGALAARPADSMFFQAAPAALQADAELGNRAEYLTADVPCAGTMTAQALARMFAALIGEVDGVRLISAARRHRRDRRGRPRPRRAGPERPRLLPRPAGNAAGRLRVEGERRKRRLRGPGRPFLLRLHAQPADSAVRRQRGTGRRRHPLRSWNGRSLRCVDEGGPGIPWWGPEAGRSPPVRSAPAPDIRCLRLAVVAEARYAFPADERGFRSAGSVPRRSRFVQRENVR
ncbi:serine hydrolase domain-containing protein [Actinoallomurus iriomotensis]|uniref:serine hydrolase domain-containing protein n=1 Tax=Actinoallomurus iriomotensis TaxID=478107 RepID=UPI002555258D|nr:serine hydrolase domain-containing protein [Actinoallomurus iriomotensis]